MTSEHQIDWHCARGHILSSVHARPVVQRWWQAQLPFCNRQMWFPRPLNRANSDEYPELHTTTQCQLSKALSRQPSFDERSNGCARDLSSSTLLKQLRSMIELAGTKWYVVLHKPHNIAEMLSIFIEWLLERGLRKKRYLYDVYLLTDTSIKFVYCVRPYQYADAVVTVPYGTAPYAIHVVTVPYVAGPEGAEPVRL